MGWPFTKFDMKPGSLHEVRATCTFAFWKDEDKTEVGYEQVEKGTVLMSLGCEERSGEFPTHYFNFLSGERIVFLPIEVHPEEYETEEEIVEAIQIVLFAFVKPRSHGYAPPRTFHRTPSLIGDSRGDDDGYDEFH